jgi:hypothetical protein
MFCTSKRIAVPHYPRGSPDWSPGGVPLARVNQQVVKLALPPRVVSGRTMVPLRFVAEALGTAVQWKSGNERNINISWPRDGWVTGGNSATSRQFFSDLGGRQGKTDSPGWEKLYALPGLAAPDGWDRICDLGGACARKMIQIVKWWHGVNGRWSWVPVGSFLLVSPVPEK